MTTKISIEPVKKELLLNCTIQHAFNVFTDKINVWWPFNSHSCFEAESAGIKIEHRVGSKVIETSHAGKTHEWGEVLEWNPPTGFSMTWHPGGTSEIATKLTVNFEQISNEKTKFLLTHENWEIHGEKALDARGNYDQGWNVVLSGFQKTLGVNL